MKRRVLVLLGAVAVAVAVAVVASVPLAAQNPGSKPTAAKAGAIPRTSWGTPDLQGVWNTATITPLERPPYFEGKEFLTEAEAAQYEKDVASGKLTPVGHVSHTLDAPGAGGAVGLYNDFWMEQGSRVVPSRRSSLIVDPRDGKIPPLTAEAQKKVAARAEVQKKRGPADSWDDFPVTTRCVIWTGGPPIIPTFYNNNYQIIQTPDYVAIKIEMVSDFRIIPISNRPHINTNVRLWHGDSRGRWEGDTLVVDTTNMTDHATTYPINLGPRTGGIREKLHLVERFTRVDANTIKYEFTVEDPSTYTRPWSVEVPMNKSTEKVFEFACHEGNYALPNILGGARSEERAAAVKGSKNQ